jgi:hypothetical protein
MTSGRLRTVVTSAAPPRRHPASARDLRARIGRRVLHEPVHRHPQRPLTLLGRVLLPWHDLHPPQRRKRHKTRDGSQALPGHEVLRLARSIGPETLVSGLLDDNRNLRGVRSPLDGARIRARARSSNGWLGCSMPPESGCGPVPSMGRDRQRTDRQVAQTKAGGESAVPPRHRWTAPTHKAN